MVSKKGKSNFLGFRCHPEPGSPESILSDYLGERGFKKEAMLEALRAYWLPLALKNAGVEGSELEEAAWDAVFTLQKQLNYICAVLDLDRSKLGLGGKMLVQQAPATGNGGGGDGGGSQKRSETPEERKKRIMKETLPNAPEYTRGSGFEDWG